MCTVTISTLTLAGLLQDPLVQLMMRSDNVSEADHSALMHQVKRALVARDTGPAWALSLSEHTPDHAMADQYRSSEKREPSVLV